ncbi:AMP-binding protein [Luteolibacter flavescens]|uniref:AMP-binding protein n=1 Tax=Luteolibacter flavescens TaxID=1859460 RepID=A0ABT3FUA7_9BACT|nr:AMP-binding protein [Luteolibacter flavescens]MCW1887169.1 AMP-binding protein [Luteolibacter flavescens]
METSRLIRPDFWESDAPVMMGGGPEADVPGLVFFRTSGSTGTPKWIGLSRRALMVSAAAVNRHLDVTRDSCWALTLPVDHVGGFGVVARVFESGCRLAEYGRKWDAAECAAWLGECGATHLSLVPTQVHDLVAAGLRAPASLRAIVVGGGVLAESTGRAARELGWPVLASFGMTETCSQVATQPLEVLDSPYHPLPIPLLPCWEARVDGDGRILLKGDALFSGMLVHGDGGWKYEERSSEWHVTSDSGRVEGRDVFLTGRADAQVKILGELVDPVAVEAELLTLSSRRDFVVTAIPDERAGHRLVLVHEGGDEAFAEALAAYHAACAGFRRISRCVAVERIPRSPLGKPLRKELSQIVANLVL